MTDPVADMINRIKNAQAVSKESVKVPHSNLKYGIAKLLEKEGWIGSVEKKGKNHQKSIEIALRYEAGNPVISGIKKISKPGQRIYLPAKRIKKVRDGFGIMVVSTPKGLLTDKEARRQKIGGEILFEIW